VIRRLFLGTGLAITVLMSIWISAAADVPFPLGTAHRNLTYCSSQQLDLYIPRTAPTGPLPIALYVHGGGFTAGDKSDLNPTFLDALASAGYAVVSLNYRLAPASHFPTQIEDVKCAIRYLRAKASHYHLNGSQIYAFGTSVGGQLVALAALTGSHSRFDVGPYRTEPSNVAAVVDMFGPANLTQAASGFSPSGIQDAFGRNDHRDLVLASPVHYVVPHAPPILLVQGADDTKVLKSQSVEFYRDLKSAGDQAQLVLVQHMGHMFMQVGSKPIDPSIRMIAHEMVSFFNAERSPS
jgi:acetyl esterase/lipase